MTTIRCGPPKSASLPAWKFEAPRLGDRLIARERALAKVEAHLGRDRASGDVLLVSAPAGYGKTTLLAQWAARSTVPVAWYHIDEGDDDPATFILGLVRALREALPARYRSRGRWAVKELFDNVRAGSLTPLDLGRATKVLANDLRQHITQPMALILTGVDHLMTSDGAHSVLDGLLGRSPDYLRIAMEAREIPTLRLSPLLPQGRLEGIGLEDLQLTDDELPALLARIGVASDSDYQRQLQELCAGWVMGVLLATGALWPTCLAARASDELNRDAVFAYLASEVIDRLPPDLSAFATRASLLTYMTQPLCTQFLGVPDARALLVALEKQTGFVTHAGRRPQEPVFRFQPLLRQVLLDHLRRDLADTDQLCALHLDAGKCLEEQGDLEEAVQHYCRAQAFERVVALIEQQKGPLLRAGRGATLVRWLDRLPESVRAQHPVLHILLAEQHRIAGRTAEARAAIQRVCEQLLPNACMHPALAAQALTVRALVQYRQGYYEEARRDCESALQLLPDQTDALRVEALFTLATTVSILEGSGAAAALLEETEIHCTRLGDLSTLARLYYVQSNFAIARGALLEAERTASFGLRYAQEANDELRSIACLLNLGAVRQFLGQTVTARADLESALAQADAAGHIQAQAYALVNLGDLEVTRGDYNAALALYDRVNGAMAAIADHHLRVCGAAGKGYALALRGEAGLATLTLTQTMLELSDAEHGADWLLLTIALGFACYRAGDLARADTLLAQAATSARNHGARAELARALLTRSAVRVAQRRDHDARTFLLEALSIAGQVDGTPTLLLDARHLPAIWPLMHSLQHPLLETLLGILAAETRSVSANTTITAAGSANTASPRIDIHLFGEARVEVDGQRITRWPRPRMRELLFFLLDRREPVRNDVILDAVWSEKYCDVADSEFRKARSELKKAFGQQCLVQRDGYWQFTLPCHVDAYEFQRLADEGERLAAAGDSAAACVALSEALSLWAGPYVDELNSDWAVQRREALHRRYMDLLERLADLEMETRQHGQAAKRYYQLLEVEPYRESAHRGLMRYFAARGEFARAVAQFRSCVNILRTEIAVSPDPQTITLYHNIALKLQSSARSLVSAHPAAV